MELEHIIYRCIPCNFETKSKSNYRNHMYTMRHYKNVKKNQGDNVSVSDHLEEISPTKSRSKSKSTLTCSPVNEIVSSPWDYGD